MLTLPYPQTTFSNKALIIIIIFSHQTRPVLLKKIETKPNKKKTKIHVESLGHSSLQGILNSDTYYSLPYIACGYWYWYCCCWYCVDLFITDHIGFILHQDGLNHHHHHHDMIMIIAGDSLLLKSVFGRNEEGLQETHSRWLIGIWVKRMISENWWNYKIMII